MVESSPFPPPPPKKKGVENTVGKGEIAHYEHFLLFTQCFQKDLYSRLVRTRACLGKGQVSEKGGLTHYQTTNFRLFQIERVCRRQFQI